MPNDSKARLTPENDPQRFSSYLQKYRTPTADAEALQAPTIDPIIALAAGLGGGVMELGNAAMEHPGAIGLTRGLDILGRGVSQYGPGSAYMQLLNSYITPNSPVRNAYTSLPVNTPHGMQEILDVLRRRAKIPLPDDYL